jgi:allantoate deiminase
VDGINKKRLLERIDRLAKCSETFPGVTRLSFTKQCDEADLLLREWMEEAGMVVRRDEMNNLIGRYEGKNREGPVLMLGSHIDSVINGGKYDGTLGVITAIEVIQVLSNLGEIPSHPIEVVSFCDEEGVKFHTTFLGSRAMTGALTLDDLARCDERGISLSDAMRSRHLNPEDFQMAKRKPDSILGYLELHIEQGPLLEKINQPCGVVSGIAGVSRYSFLIEGMSGHAGTVPMYDRKDALTGAAEIIVKLEQLAKQYSPAVATVGKLSVKPGASNVIPEIVEGTIDIRDQDEKRKTMFLKDMVAMAYEVCKRRKLTCEFEKVMEVPPVSCSNHFIHLIEDVLEDNGISPYRMISGAGHDAMAIASLTPIGMIFVRCKKGLSHCPDEDVSLEDMEIGTKILLDTVRKITDLA